MEIMLQTWHSVFCCYLSIQDLSLENVAQHAATTSPSTLMSSPNDDLGVSLHTKLVAMGFLARISSKVQGIVFVIEKSSFGGGENALPSGPDVDEFAHDVSLVQLSRYNYGARATGLATLVGIG